MSDSQEWQPWSDNPNAPKIPHDQYTDEKEYFAAILIGSILYGMPEILLYTCPFIPAHSVCLTYPRDSHPSVLQMHGCAA